MEGPSGGCLLQHPHIATCHHAAIWGVLHNSPHSVSCFLSKLSHFIFFSVLVQFLCCFLEAFLIFDFFEFSIPGNIWMLGFYRFWPCSIWSYGCWDIASERKVTQCRKFCNIFLEKFISLNPWQLLSNPFYEK